MIVYSDNGHIPMHFFLKYKQYSFLFTFKHNCWNCLLSSVCLQLTFIPLFFSLTPSQVCLGYNRLSSQCLIVTVYNRCCCMRRNRNKEVDPINIQWNLGLVDKNTNPGIKFLDGGIQRNMAASQLFSACNVQISFHNIGDW